MAEDPQNEKNIVNLAEARKRQRTVRGASKNANGKGDSGKGKGKPGGKRFWAYVQLFLFLAVVAYMMQLCRGP